MPELNPTFSLTENSILRMYFSHLRNTDATYTHTHTHTHTYIYIYMPITKSRVFYMLQRRYQLLWKDRKDTIFELHDSSEKSVFRRKADNIRVLLWYNTAFGGKFLPTFRDNLSVQSSRFKNPRYIHKQQNTLICVHVLRSFCLTCLPLNCQD
jgi:hypothetical protein